MITRVAPTVQGVAVQLSVFIRVPTSVDQGDVLKRLFNAAQLSQGITLMMPQGDKVDVDLVHVMEVG